ncbi:MAG: hypothetical protein F4Y94_01145 [Chloroflexi bacterium]|jgi:hypothetical protein|nr:hypothetical protein [Chloroflexota bacterium]
MFSYERESRTPQSEAYVIENEQGSRARADLHFTPSIVYSTLCVPADWSEDDIRDVIADLDDRIVRTADPFREDFVVTVWSGDELAVYSDEESLNDYVIAGAGPPGGPAERAE